MTIVRRGGFATVVVVVAVAVGSIVVLLWTTTTTASSSSSSSSPLISSASSNLSSDDRDRRSYRRGGGRRGGSRSVTTTPNKAARLPSISVLVAVPPGALCEKDDNENGNGDVGGGNNDDCGPDRAAVTRKLLRDLRVHRRNDESDDEGEEFALNTVAMNLREQRAYLEEHSSDDDCGETITKRFDSFVRRDQDHLASELWKYCAARTVVAADADEESAVAILDATSPLLVRFQDVIRSTMTGGSSDIKNMAVLGDVTLPRTIHGSLLVLKRDAAVSISKTMLQVLLTTDVALLEGRALYLPQTLYEAIQQEVATSGGTGGGGDVVVVNKELGPGLVDDWFFLEEKCHVNPLLRDPGGSASTSSSFGGGSSGSGSGGWNFACPDAYGYCCTTYSSWMPAGAVQISRHALLPNQRVSHDDAQQPLPYNAAAGHYQQDEVPFISILQERVMQRPAATTSEGDEPSAVVSQNFFDVLLNNDCLPSGRECSVCLHDKRGADCRSCAKVCSCFCKTLCHEKPPAKRVSKEINILPPRYARDPHRLIPRIVHQTYFEELTPEGYPNMSRLVESFKRSGWEYKFYNDEDAANFLSTHFPAEVRQAYDALRPGAFKADLFRYCALLIHGGVYADVDVLLESALDYSIAPDVGFMVPMDEPGAPVNRRMCLWNGFIAAAPGHPYLSLAIQTIVNQVRNRYTSVDVDATFCPSPELSILHAFDTLFTAGPCLLGASINRVHGLHGQTPFVPGDIRTNVVSPEKGAAAEDEEEDGGYANIPGRSIILQQNKWDMGAHRFTWAERNLVVAGTDLPDSNDRDNVAGTGVHYSKTHATTGIYGLQNLYADAVRANEDVKFVIRRQGDYYQQQHRDDDPKEQAVVRDDKKTTRAAQRP